MIKTPLLAIAMLLALSAPCLAQTAEPSADKMASKPMMAARPHKPFPELKAEVLARLHQRLACVEAAQDREALRACAPQREGHRVPSMLHAPSEHNMQSGRPE